MSKCDKCGKDVIRGKERYTKIDGKGMYVCLECYEKIKNPQELENRKIKKERMKNKKIKYVKDLVDNSGLSIPELQLYELKKLKDEMEDMKVDLKIVMIIIVIWFILGIIGLILTYNFYNSLGGF